MVLISMTFPSVSLYMYLVRWRSFIHNLLNVPFISWRLLQEVGKLHDEKSPLSHFNVSFKSPSSTFKSPLSRYVHF